MQVSVLGSCSVIDFPADIEQFFNNDNLVDIRNGHLMEMDALPLLFLAEMIGDQTLYVRVCQAILANLKDSGGELWKCGVWGHDETHCRFSSVALRLMLINIHYFDRELIIKSLDNHLSHQESALEGVWFFHDSIETNKQSYYRRWAGQACLDASPNNMLILNTHIDTLITLLVAQHYRVSDDKHHKLITQGLTSLKSYFLNTEVVSGASAYIDRLIRSILLLFSGKKDLLSRGVAYVINRFYYQSLRYKYKQKKNIRAFSDGYLERDIRLSGFSLEYHVVNIWDMSKLLLWMHYNHLTDSTVSKFTLSATLDGLKYCFHSKAYRLYIKRISLKKGVSNEVLEAIAILFILGHRTKWMVELYLDWRTFAPPSVGILGYDKSISAGAALQSHATDQTDIPLGVDWIPFDIGLVFVANNNAGDYHMDKAGHSVEWKSISSLSVNVEGNGTNIIIPAKSIVILRKN